jgi:outer membrane protein OmpA-like peptidoglycan-associated protein
MMLAASRSRRAFAIPAAHELQEHAHMKQQTIRNDGPRLRRLGIMIAVSAALAALSGCATTTRGTSAEVATTSGRAGGAGGQPVERAAGTGAASGAAVAGNGAGSANASGGGSSGGASSLPGDAGAGGQSGRAAAAAGSQGGGASAGTSAGGTGSGPAGDGSAGGAAAANGGGASSGTAGAGSSAGGVGSAAGAGGKGGSTVGGGTAGGGTAGGGAAGGGTVAGGGDGGSSAGGRSGGRSAGGGGAGAGVAGDGSTAGDGVGGGDSATATAGVVEAPGSRVHIEEEVTPQTLGGLLPLTVGVDEAGQFDFDQAVLRPEVKGLLDELATRLRDAEWDRLDIVGYTDRIGTPDYNLHLSEQRAWAVARYLTDQGIPVYKMKVKGRGEADSLVGAEACRDLDREELIACLQKDRRVQIEASIRKTQAKLQ